MISYRGVQIDARLVGVTLHHNVSSRRHRRSKLVYVSVGERGHTDSCEPRSDLSQSRVWVACRLDNFRSIQRIDEVRRAHEKAVRVKRFQHPPIEPKTTASKRCIHELVLERELSIANSYAHVQELDSLVLRAAITRSEAPKRTRRRHNNGVIKLRTPM